MGTPGGAEVFALDKGGPGPTKVGAGLVDVHMEYAEYEASPGLEPFRPTNPFLQVVDERVIVDAVASGPVEDLLADLNRLGLEGAATFGQTISGRLPVAAIPELRPLDSLKFARAALAVTQVGLTTSQGDAAMRSDFTRALFGVDGTGVIVGTLSDSYDCLTGAATDVASGDLPAGIVVLDDSLCPNTDEGRAMMQLIADVAPGAGQAFHTAFGGQADFASGIVELATVAGADVIVDDVFYFAEPFFQDGIIAQAVDTVNAMGVAFFSSAGNQARQSYEAPFRGSGLVPPGLLFPGEGHDFDPGAGTDIFQEITLPSGITIIILQWDSPYFSASGGLGSPNDIDLYLYLDPPGAGPVISSIAGNLGGDPIEIMGISNGGPPLAVNLAITNFLGPDPGTLKFVYLRSAMSVNEFGTTSSTVFGHSNAVGAEAVGAAPYFDTPEFGTDPPLLESFSSAGPTPILFDLSDLPVVEMRAKPNLVCPDGTNTTFFGFDFEPDGFPNFFGTSAAAPHAAAVAALLLEANPALTPADIFTAMESTAIDMELPGFDDDSGHGLCQADAALLSCIVSPDVSLSGPATIDTTESIEVCQSLSVADVDIVTPGNVSYTAGLSIEFLSGFSVKPGATMSAAIDPGLLPPP